MPRQLPGDSTAVRPSEASVMVGGEISLGASPFTDSVAADVPEEVPWELLAATRTSRVKPTSASTAEYVAPVPTSLQVAAEQRSHS